MKAKRWGFTHARTGREFVRYDATREGAALGMTLDRNVPVVVFRDEVRELPSLEDERAVVDDLRAAPGA